MSPDGAVSAAAAWDPNYNPPASAQASSIQPEYILTTSPRTSMAVKDRGSSFMIRFGLSRPVEPSDIDHTPRPSSLRGAAPSSHSMPPSQTPAAEPTDGPMDPNHKKNIRGAR